MAMINAILSGMGAGDLPATPPRPGPGNAQRRPAPSRAITAERPQRQMRKFGYSPQRPPTAPDRPPSAPGEGLRDSGPVSCSVRLARAGLAADRQLMS
jgi:hypothetical protein